MAGDWIKFELTTLDKPEVCQIAALADIDLDAAVGKLLRVWGWFDQQTESGNAPSVSKKLLDRLVGVIGFCEHMKSVGWMEECEGVISLPHFDRHNGKTAKNRLLTAKRVANHKAANAKGSGKGNDAGVSGALPREDVDVDKKLQQQQGQAPDPAHPPATPPAPTPESWQRFPMHKDWAPDDENLGTHLQLIGVAAELITPDVLAEFVSYWLARSETANNQATWCRTLVMSAKARSVKAAAKPAGQQPAAGRTSQHNNLDNQDHREGLEDNGNGTYSF